MATRRSLLDVLRALQRSSGTEEPDTSENSGGNELAPAETELEEHLAQNSKHAKTAIHSSQVEANSNDFVNLGNSNEASVKLDNGEIDLEVGSPRGSLKLGGTTAETTFTEDPVLQSPLGQVLVILHQKDASVTNRVLAYSIVLTIACKKAYSAENGELWAEVLSIAIQDLGHSASDVRQSAVLTLRSMPLMEKIKLLMTKQGVEDQLKLSLLDPKSAIRQVAISSLAGVLTQVWVDIVVNPWRLEELEYFRKLEGAEKSSIVDTCKDRVVDVWKAIVLRTTDSCDMVAGSAFQALADLVEPGKNSNASPWILDNPFNPLTDISSVNDALRPLRRRVLEHLSAKIELVLLRVESFWPRSPALTVLGVNPPSSSLFLPMSKALRDPVFLTNVSLIETPQSHFRNMQSPEGGAFSSANFQGFARLGRSVSSMDDSDVEVDIDEDEESTLPGSPTSRRQAVSVGGASDLAAIALDFASGLAGLRCIQKLFFHLLNPIKPPTFRPISEDRLSRQVLGPSVAVETNPIADMSSFIEVPIGQLYRSWIDKLLQRWINTPHNPYITLCTAEHILDLLSSCKPASAGISSQFRANALMGIIIALCRILKNLRSLQILLRDLERSQFHLRTLRVLKRCCQASEGLFDLQIHAKNLCFLIREYALSLQRVRSAFASANNYNRHDGVNLGVKGFVSEELQGVWTSLVALPLEADTFWSILSAKEPGILQEMLRNNPKDPILRYALCSTFFEALFSSKKKKTEPERWYLDCLRALELFNPCLMWDVVSSPYFVQSTYLDLVDAFVSQIVSSTASSPAHLCNDKLKIPKRMWLLLQRMIDFNLDFSNETGNVLQRQRLIEVLCRGVGLLASKKEFSDVMMNENTSYVSCVSDSLLNALAFELSGLLGHWASSHAGERHVALNIVRLIISLACHAPSLVPPVDKFLLKYRDSVISQEVRVARRRLGLVKAIAHNQPLPYSLTCSANKSQREDNILKKWGISNHSSGKEGVFFTSKLGGAWDPLVIYLCCTQIHLRDVLSVRVHIVNQTQETITGDVNVSLGCDGPCFIETRKSIALASGPFMPESSCEVSVFYINVISFNDLSREMRKLPNRRESFEMAEEDSMVGAVASNIASARKRGSGKSFKAVLEPTESALSENVERGQLEKSPRRSSLTLSKRRMMRPSLIVTSSRRSLFGNSQSSNRSLSELAQTSEDHHIYAQQNESIAQNGFGSGSGNKGEYIQYGPGIDLLPRALYVSLTFDQGKLSFPTLQLPASIFCLPYDGVNKQVDGFASSFSDSELPQRFGGWVALDRFRTLWASLKFSHTKQSNHLLALRESTKNQHVNLETVVVSVDMACKSLTRVMIEPYLIPGELAQCSFVGRTWGGTPFALSARISLANNNEASIKPCPGSLYFSIAWDVRCASTELHKTWSREDHLSYFINSFIPA